MGRRTGRRPRILFRIPFRSSLPVGFGYFPAIYRIYNTDNGKAYIGSTVQFRNRFYQHRSRVRRGVNTRVTSAFQHHGEEAFEWQLLECVARKEDLVVREQYFIDIFKPEYNLRKYAESNFGIEILATQKEFTLVGPDGKSYKGKGVYKFAEDHVGSDGTKLVPSTLAALTRGKVKHHKGWHRPDTNPEDIYKHFGRRKTFTVRMPDGHFETFTGITEFEQRHDVSGISALLSKKIKSVQGITLPETDYATIFKPRRRKFTLRHHKFGVISHNNVPEFCAMFGIPGATHITDVIAGSRRSSLGWTLPKTDRAKIRRPVGEPFFVKDPDGVVYKSANQRAFARKHGLQYKQLSQLLRIDDTTRSHQRWVAATQQEYEAQQNGAPPVPQKLEPNRPWQGKKRSPKTKEKIAQTMLWNKVIDCYLVISPNGQTYEVVNLSAFASANDLHYHLLMRVSRGDMTHYKKWKVCPKYLSESNSLQ